MNQVIINEIDKAIENFEISTCLECFDIYLGYNEFRLLRLLNQNMSAKPGDILYTHFYYKGHEVFQVTKENHIGIAGYHKRKDQE